MGRPCDCDRYVPGEPRVAGRDCVKCWLWHNSPASRAAWEAAPAERLARLARRVPRPAPAPLPVLRPVCRHEGPVVSHAKCGDRAHLRQCLHDGADWDLCTRGENRGGAQACLTCGLHERAPGGRSILLTGGIGDVFAVEGMMTAEERETLEAVYYACPAAAVIRPAFEALPGFPRLTQHVTLNTGRRTYLSMRRVLMHGHSVPEGTEDWSIGAIFPQRRPYTGSGFIAHTMHSAPRRPPGPYVVVQPVSSWGRWPNRDFNAADWARLRAFLEARGLYGVVLNEHGSPLPDWPCLIGWQGVTTLPESIEILKAAEGYVGIDSCLSVLAAKLFPARRLAVKGTRSHVYDHAWAYYQPHAEFPFLKTTLDPPPWD